MKEYCVTHPLSINVIIKNINLLNCKLSFGPQISNREDDENCTLTKSGKYENTEKGNEKEVGDGCGLTLSLSLHHPSTLRSNDSSITSEISEAISSYSRSNFNECSGSYSEKLVNVDLSLALCGT